MTETRSERMEKFQRLIKNSIADCGIPLSAAEIAGVFEAVKHEIFVLMTEDDDEKPPEKGHVEGYG